MHNDRQRVENEIKICMIVEKLELNMQYSIFTTIFATTSQSRFDPNWAVAQDLELELKSKLEPKLES